MYNRIRCSTCSAPSSGVLMFAGIVGSWTGPSCGACAVEALHTAACAVRWSPSSRVALR